MKKLITGILSACILVIALISLTTATEASLSDTEKAAGNILRAGTPELWNQTTQADFALGLLNNVEISSSPDNVKLSKITGNTPVTSNNTEVHTDSNSYLQVKTLTITKSGSVNNILRFDTDLRASKSNNSLASLRIIINGTIFTHETESSSYLSYSDQLDISGYTDGNYSLTLYLKISKNNVSAYNSVFSIYAVNNSYAPSGTIASQVLNTANSGSKWNALFWEAGIPANTGLSFEVRASNSSFTKDDNSLSWIAAGASSPLLFDLPGGKYKQWRAILNTNDNGNSPILKEVRLYYFP
jgi:hypothetical protein